MKPMTDAQFKEWNRRDDELMREIAQAVTSGDAKAEKAARLASAKNTPECPEDRANRECCEAFMRTIEARDIARRLVEEKEVWRLVTTYDDAEAKALLDILRERFWVDDDVTKATTAKAAQS